MNLVLHLSSETENKLKAHSILTGRSLEELAIEALQEKLASENGSGEPLSNDARRAEFQAWLASHPASEVGSLDDTRETIYQSRGE